MHTWGLACSFSISKTWECLSGEKETPQIFGGMNPWLKLTHTRFPFSPSPLINQCVHRCVAEKVGNLWVNIWIEQEGNHLKVTRMSLTTAENCTVFHVLFFFHGGLWWAPPRLHSHCHSCGFEEKGRGMATFEPSHGQTCKQQIFRC